MNKKLPLLIILCGIVISATGLVHAQDLDIISTPPLEWTHEYIAATYNYGDVVLGESKTVTFSLESIGVSRVIIYLIALIDDPTLPGPHTGAYPPDLWCWNSFCFSPDTYQLTPLILAPGESSPLDVTFTPDSLGEHTVYLWIYSDDAYPPPGSVAYIELVGTGISGPTPEEQIDEIQDFFDESVTSGELVGIGATETSAAGKLNALENMLEQAEYLIDTGDITGACAQLHSAYEKTDGVMLPPDFVSGPAAEDLARMIQGLMDSLGCE